MYYNKMIDMILHLYGSHYNKLQTFGNAIIKFVILILRVPSDLYFYIEAQFLFSNFLLLSLSPGINQYFIVHIFSISD